MSRYIKPLSLISSVILGLPLCCQIGFAAKPINLRHLPYTSLNSLSGPAINPTGINIEEKSRQLDFNRTLHVRVQETFQGFPVWGADGVIHIPHANKNTNLTHELSTQKQSITMNGIFYTDLAKDLKKGMNTFTNNATKAYHFVLTDFENNNGKKVAIQNKQTKIIVYVDDKHVAHWAYHIQFDAARNDEHAIPKRPTYIIDANTLTIYKKWDEIKTIEKKGVLGGGFGGNIKMGKLIYDGLPGDLPALGMTRNSGTKVCSLKNDIVTVKHYSTRKIMSFGCEAKDANHNNVYWDGDFDAVNGGYNPSNDALFGGISIDGMYRKWYGVPVLTENDKPMVLTMVVHDPIDNAYWDGRQMTFGDGVRYFYPLTSLGVAAHEISHGFTQQHSDLTYHGQSGGMNEAFSDMAAQAAEFYAYGKNSWQIGPEIFKAENQALRYMDQPSKDCEAGSEPGDWCSIDVVSQYYPGLDVHFSSGIYNRVFYLMGTAAGWDTKKAFDVMVQANSHYWTSDSSFNEGACGILSAATDLKYDDAAIKSAFEVVGIETTDC